MSFIRFLTNNLQIKTAVNQLMTKESAQTPKSDTECILKATNNVFGRVINGVHFGTECQAEAIEEVGT